jgi:hypothetical protein
MAANGHRRPATPSHTEPRNTCSGGTSSHVCHRPATLRACLVLKQVTSSRGDLEENPQHNMPGDHDAQRREQPGRSLAANSRATVFTWAVSREIRPW